MAVKQKQLAAPMAQPQPFEHRVGIRLRPRLARIGLRRLGPRPTVEQIEVVVTDDARQTAARRNLIEGAIYLRPPTYHRSHGETLEILDIAVEDEVIPVVGVITGEHRCE